MTPPAGQGTGHKDAGSPPVIDWARLQEIGEYDDERGSMIRKVVGSFVSGGKARTEAIKRAAARRDSAALVSAAHALRGAALNVGASAVAAACGSVENWVREGRTAGLVPLVTALTAQFSEAAQLLRKDVLKKTGERDRIPRRARIRKRGSTRRKSR